ncbi:hypothetical protein, partial [Pseudomonas sp. sia0905]|uniref:hypothetical protein n=1 Tax=Pseudomonas sp. sia0905 TaxID=2854783 RepID=UPI001C4977A2
GNLVNGLSQINSDSFHHDSPAQKSSTPWYRTVVWGESITAFKEKRGREKGADLFSGQPIFIELQNTTFLGSNPCGQTFLIWSGLRESNPFPAPTMLCKAPAMLDCARILNALLRFSLLWFRHFFDNHTFVFVKE